MREIKFRAYHYWAWDPRIEWYMMYSEKDNWWNLRIFFENVQNEALWVEVMQYTWLKDKNWKEIYEGDILKHHKQWTWKVFYPFHNNYASFWIENSKTWFMNTLQDAQIYKIIWNIYENPELLLTNK